MYVFGWLVAYIVDRAFVKGKKEKTFIFISVWTYVIFNVTLFLVTFITCKYFVNKLIQTRTNIIPNVETDGTPTQASYDDDTIGYVEKITWMLYSVSLTMTFMVTVGYYTAAGTSFDDFDVFALHIHGINLLIMCTDFLLSQIPIHFLHFCFPTLFVVIYLIFTGIYYAAGGITAQGKPYIYPLLDYQNNLGRAILLAVVMVVLTAIVHCIFSVFAILRDYVATRCNCCNDVDHSVYEVTQSTSALH